MSFSGGVSSLHSRNFSPILSQVRTFPDYWSRLGSSYQASCASGLAARTNPMVAGLVPCSSEYALPVRLKCGPRISQPSFSSGLIWLSSNPSGALAKKRELSADWLSFAQLVASQRGHIPVWSCKYEIGATYNGQLRNSSETKTWGESFNNITASVSYLYTPHGMRP
jgi:hypothetical protein